MNDHLPAVDCVGTASSKARMIESLSAYPLFFWCFKGKKILLEEVEQICPRNISNYVSVQET